MKELEGIEQEVSTWPNISVRANRFGGRAFFFGNAEVGHIHTGGAIDIPFPRSFRDELLAQGLAEEHRWVPDSGWVTFRVRSEEDMEQALGLLRLSYLRYALRKDSNPGKLLEREAEEILVTPRLKALLERVVPVGAI